MSSQGMGKGMGKGLNIWQPMFMKKGVGKGKGKSTDMTCWDFQKSLGLWAGKCRCEQGKNNNTDNAMFVC